MYDPVLARFVSADSVVPGSASGSLDGIALKPLTVDFHEVGFGATLNGENGQPFWFQLSDDEKQKVGDPWGPANAQALNRYSYVLNGPMKATDPTGHDTITFDATKKDELGHTEVDQFINQLQDATTSLWNKGMVVAAATIGLGVIVPPAGVIGVAELVITWKVVEDATLVLRMLQDVRDFVNNNGGGKVSLTVNSNGYVQVEGFSNKPSANGNNYFKKYTTTGISLASARFIQTAMSRF